MQPTILRNWQSVAGGFVWTLPGGLTWRLNPALPGAPLTLRNPDDTILAEPFVLDALIGRTDASSDVYLRPGNLVMHLPETGGFPLELLMEFRPFPAPDGVEALELVLSMQTSLLDATPIGQIRGNIPPGELMDLEPAAPAGIRGVAPAFATELAAVSQCVVLTDAVAAADHKAQARAIHFFAGYPGDVEWLAVTRLTLDHAIQCRLRTERLEKGVIRRLRLLYGFSLLGDGGVAAARERTASTIQAFEESRLPLTA